MKEKYYTDLTPEEQRKTFDNYQELCEKDKNMVPFNSFQEYDFEQRFINLSFDADTLECLG